VIATEEAPPMNEKFILIITANLHIIRMCQLAFERNTLGNLGASPPLSATFIF